MSKAPAVNTELGSTDHFPTMGFSEVWDSVLVPVLAQLAWVSWWWHSPAAAGGTAMCLPPWAGSDTWERHFNELPHF